MSFNWFKQWENVLVLSFAALLLILHLISIDLEEKLWFDEKYYVLDANYIVHGVGQLDYPEHTPLAKLFIASSIDLFGNEPIGWRIFPILFGVAAIILFYLICQKLTANRHIPLIATFIFAFENMSFVMSSVAMLDIFGLTLMLASFLLYLHNRYIPAGVVLALAALAKVTAAFGGGIILLHWLFIKRAPKRNGLKFLIVAPLAFLILMPFFDYLATNELLWPWDRIDYIVTTHSSATFAKITDTREILSRPWEWVISPKPMTAPSHPTYQFGMSWTLWALIVPSMCYMIFKAIKQRWNSLCLFAFLWFAGTYVIWIPIYFITDRIMYRFYFYPAVGAVCLALGYTISALLTVASRQSSKKAQWAIRIPVILWMIGHFAVFWVMSPII